MNIDFLSLSIGIAIGLILSNLIALLTAYIRRAKARAAAKVVYGNLEKIKQDLLARKQVVLNRIKEKKEKNDRT